MKSLTGAPLHIRYTIAPGIQVIGQTYLPPAGKVVDVLRLGPEDDEALTSEGL